MLHLTIFTDGGSRGNPGEAAIGVSVQDENGQEIGSISQAIGIATNNEAEYQAFVASLDWLLQFQSAENQVASVTWKLDSKLVVEQLQKNWKIKEPRMQTFAQQAWQKMDGLEAKLKIQHVPRAENKRADQLVNLALDLA